MSERIEVTRPDGGMCPAYITGAGPQPALVLIQEWWGLNAQIKRTADRFAEAGYRTLVPDLFRGRLAGDADEAKHLMGGLDFADAAKQDIQGAVTFLLQDSARCAVAGFCMGGALAILAAVHVEGLHAGACFYGIPPKEAADPSRIRIPMIYHFADKDEWCTPTAVDSLEADLEKGGEPYELHRYAADHAFMNEARPEVYDPASAQRAWKRTLTFLEHRLRG